MGIYISLCMYIHTDVFDLCKKTWVSISLSACIFIQMCSIFAKKHVYIYIYVYLYLLDLGSGLGVSLYIHVSMYVYIYMYLFLLLLRTASPEVRCLYRQGTTCPTPNAQSRLKS